MWRRSAVPSMWLLASLSGCGGDSPGDDAAADSDAATGGFSADVPARMYPGSAVPLGAIDEALRVAESSGRIVTVGDTTWFIAPASAETVILQTLDPQGVVLQQKTINVLLPPPKQVSVATADDTSATGTYGDIEFSARLDTEADAGSAEAIYRDAAGAELRIHLVDENRATMSWNGIVLDGAGPLTNAEAQALHRLATAPLGGALAHLPLQLRCVTEVPAPALAALLFPWQLLLKYEVVDRQTVIQHFFDANACPGQTSDFDEELQANIPTESPIWWSSDQAVPVVFPWFPFDAEGQRELAAHE